MSFWVGMVKGEWGEIQKISFCIFKKFIFSNIYPQFSVKRLTGRWESLGQICSEGVGLSNEGMGLDLLGEEILDLTLFSCKSGSRREPLEI